MEHGGADTPSSPDTRDPALANEPADADTPSPAAERDPALANEPADADTPSCPGNEGGEALADRLPVELTVELGRIQLTAAEFLELEAGDVLTLDHPTAVPLDLRVGDRLLGRGQLVDVEGEAGVQVLEIYD